MSKVLREEMTVNDSAEQVEHWPKTEPTIAEVAGTYPALEDAIAQTPSHVHPPRTGFILPTAEVAFVGAIVEAESVDDAIAGVPLRPSIAAIHAEINRRANLLAAARSQAEYIAKESAATKASIERHSAELLDLMRDAGIASTRLVFDGLPHVVTVVVKHDYDIVDLDAAVAHLTGTGEVPMTKPVEPKVDTTALKRMAKVAAYPIPGVVPTESAHLRWT